ncbi:MAG: hypothetical protein GX051_10030 [Clostridiales bacterium]|nr:hypothetical protein [Clostridiales bacterium]
MKPLYENVPDVMTFCDGRKVKTASDWRDRRQEILEILQQNEYGVFPPPPDTFTSELLERRDSFCADKASLEKHLLCVSVGKKDFSFPVYRLMPKNINNPKAFVFINFRDNIPDEYFPAEEIIDNGFAVYSFCYKDVSCDNGDFSSGAAGMFFDSAKRSVNAPGKLSIWAWAASRVMDFVISDGVCDIRNVAVIGHSRLGKTALLAAASDERFSCAVSNNSGCAGAALERGKQGERVKDIVKSFPFWFCPRYADYAGNEGAMPFDQHFLLALIAPRRVYVSSAEEDTWADPSAEYASCVLASQVWELLGTKGLGGCEGYHLRPGTHYLSRYDWQQFMKYLKTEG